MNLPSPSGKFRNQHLTAAARRRARRTRRLDIESLETREVPATLPTVLSVTPATGEALTTSIVVKFSENVNGAGTAGNYSLFAQDGKVIPLTGTVTYDPATFTATITPGSLPAGTYSLFIQADQIVDTDGDNLKLGQSGQLVIANDNPTGGGNLTTVPMVPAGANAGLGAGTALPLAAGGNPRQPAVGDLNGDGILDLVAPADGTSQVQIFFGRAAGGYNATPTVLTLASGKGPVSVALGDVDGLNGLDIVTADRGGNDVAVFLQGPTAGTFSAPTYVGVGKTPTDVVLVDLNKDGSLDLAVGHNGAPLTGRGVTVRLNNGSGTFLAPAEVLPDVRAGAIAVGDFNRDGNPDLAVAENLGIGTVRILRGTGDGTFTDGGRWSVGANPTDVVVADFNADGFSDIATVSGSATTFKDLSVLLNSAGAGFRNAIHTTLASGSPLQGLAAVYGNKDPYPDLVVTSQRPPAGSTTNVQVLTGIGDGSFVPYVAGYDLRGGTPARPSFVSVVSDPFRLLSAFDVESTTVRVNLVRNGDFSTRSLDGSQGSLDGWSVFKLRDETTGSHGAWAVQTGTESPLSSTALAQAAWPQGPLAWPVGPTGPSGPNGPQGYQAMLDQQHLIPFVNFNPNSPDSYEGSHALYQDITIPAGATATLSLRLSLNSSANWSNTAETPLLDYRPSDANQQVRVDIMRVVPGSDVLDVGSNVLKSIFVTDPSQLTQQTRTLTADLSEFAGQTVRLRVATTNNQGQLIVGVDNVKVEALGTDTTAPAVDSLTLRNPSFVPGPGGASQSNDPTILGRVADNASVNNVTKLVFDLANNGFGGPDDQAVTTFDVNGNFSLTAQGLSPGFLTVPVRVVDQAGQTFDTTVSFVVQGPSQALWRALGPGATDVSNQGVNYDTVAGKITGIAIDPRDPTGSTFFISAPNGGVWRTTDGGNDWKALTDNVTDAGGQRVNVPVGALGIGHDGVIYAATGVDDASPTSRTSVGVLRSSDDGRTWTVTGASVFAGARVSKLGVDPTDSNVAYVAVASWDDPAKPAAVFKTTDGGGNWVNVLDPANMVDPRTGPLGSGAPMASVTDLLVDPFNPGRLIVGLGNIGRIAPAASAGVWKSADGGSTWVKAIGGDKRYLVTPSTIPDGTAIGRVTLAQGAGRVGDEKVVYVLLSQPSRMDPHPFDDQSFGNDLLGLYKTKDNLLNFTKVMLREYVPNPADGKTRYLDIDLMEHEGHTVGAMVVDPANTNVVYIGGARRVGYGGDPPQHSVIRVDTGNMRDADYFDFMRGNYPNDGDDISKNDFAKNPNGGYNAWVNVQGDNTYAEEGVYWYDLEMGVINSDFSFNSFLPAAFHSVAIDPQGRVLFGTAGGLFRGTPLGFDYDFTSGSFGILGHIRDNNGNKVVFLTPPTPRGMDFNDLNGNLQINDLTGAGIDPSDLNKKPEGPDRFYTAAVEVGTGVTQGGVNAWASSGLVSQVAGIPNAVSLLVASPTPGAAPGTPPNIYRLWQHNTYLNELTRIPEISTDGGLSFRPTGLAENAGLSLNDESPVHPVMAINPTKVAVRDIVTGVTTYYDELLYGVDRVYLTRTSGNVWDAISGRLSPTGLVSALALAPSTRGVYYAGTTDGKFFARPGSGGFVDRSAGLPGARINGISVDPADANTVYVMLDVPVGGGPSLFKSTDGGQTWTAIAGTTPGALLPQLPAYSLVIDPQTNAGDVGVRLYVGTERGVFISQDGGASWAPAGQGLPAVPVVGLQINQDLETLVATTQGRGIFTLSTDHVGPSVTSARKTNQAGNLPDTNTANDPEVDQRFSQFDLRFSEDIDRTTFAADDIVVTAPDGRVLDNATLNLRVIEVVDPTVLNPKHDQWRVTFDPSKLVLDGVYTFTIGPDVLDLAGNQMNQNGVLPNGQAADKFVAKFLINENDLADFVKDTYKGLLRRPPTTTEMLATPVATMDRARLAALGVVVKELLSKYNKDSTATTPLPSEARQRLVERLFNINNGAGAPGEIGNLLPDYTLPDAVRTYYVNALKNGTRSPESIIIDIIAGTDTTKGTFIQQYFTVKSSNNPEKFLQNVYADLFKASGVQFVQLDPTVQDKQKLQAATPSGRLTLVRSLVNGAIVTYNGTKKTDFRSEEVKLAYQQLLGRAPTAAEVTAGKALIAKPLALNSIQGSEWLYWKLLSSQEYFSLQVQNDPTDPQDNGLHTNRAWVEGVIADRFFRTDTDNDGMLSTDKERDDFSRKVLANFRLQRQAFVNAIVTGTEYRTLKITEYFQMVHNREPSSTEVSAALTALATGSTFPALIAGRFASLEFYNDAPNVVGTDKRSTLVWAQAAVMRAFKLPAPPAPDDPRVKTMVSLAATYGRPTAAQWLLNTPAYRELVIRDAFKSLFGVGFDPTGFLASYQNFLKTHRWEQLFLDILANGAASAPVTADLPRTFWEVLN